MPAGPDSTPKCNRKAIFPALAPPIGRKGVAQGPPIPEGWRRTGRR